MIEPVSVLWAYGALVIVMSLTAVVLQVWDKRAARRGAWRVSERTLHRVELLGGWPGSWLVRRYIRHKTFKRSYRLRFVLIVMTHLALGVAWLLWWL